MSQQVRKAVIPAAGLGTRFLPATKAQPKEMLPLVDKPAIQYVVEEAVSVGITDILVITGRGKRSLEDHFDRSFELEYYLEEGGKLAELAEMRRIAEMAEIHYVRQGEPRGLGHAVLVASEHVGNLPFAVLLGDDIMHPDSGVLAGMLAVYERYGHSVVALKEVPAEDISSYGCAAVTALEENIVKVDDLVEKPAQDEAPSNLAVMGRYVFGPRSSKSWPRPSRGEGARSSSLTPSRRWANTNPCTAGRSAKVVSTSATSWTTWRPRWSWPWSARTSALRSDSSWLSVWAGTGHRPGQGVAS